MPLKYKEENAIYRRDPKFYNNIEQTTQPQSFDVMSDNVNDRMTYVLYKVADGGTQSTVTEDFVLTQIVVNVSIDSATSDNQAKVSIDSVECFRFPITTSLVGTTITQTIPIPNWIIKKGVVFEIKNDEAGYYSSVTFLGYRL